MKKLLTLVLCLTAAGLAVLAQNAQDKPRTVFNRADKNGDGKVTPDELPNKQQFNHYDLNGDGVITLEEGRKVFLADALERRKGDTKPATAASVPVTSGPKLVKPGDAGIGRMVPDASFADLEGKEHKLSEFSTRPATVIAMTSATCPISKRYMPTMTALQKELAAKEIPLILVNPFTSESSEEIHAQLSVAGLRAIYVHDKQKTLTSILGAKTTTEIFLIDSSRTLQYRGAIDDQYGVNYNLDAPNANYLRDAVTAFLEGRQAAVAATEAPGCELDLPSSAATQTTTVTYHRDVQRILQRNCVECHHNDGIAPFALDDIDEVKDRAKTIKRVITEATMPPWFAAPTPDSKPSPWANECSLTGRDKADLLAWLDSSDRPMGDPADAPKPLHFADGWTIGKPDYVVQIPRPVSIKADGFMPYQLQVAETTLTEDKWVQGYEILPTDRSVVHHVIVGVHTGKGKIRDRGEEGDMGYWAAYVPGNGRQMYPPGFARKLPAGARVSFQIHYTPSGKATSDQLKMGLIFAKETPRYEVQTLGVPNHSINIPPGEANHKEVGTRRVPMDLNLMALVAHMHVRGKSFRFEVKHPDGTMETLLDIPRYDFNWQLRYDYAAPKFIPQGSTVVLTAMYDNSAGNKANPDPSKRVRWGQQTFDEMMIGYFEIFTPISKNVVMK